MFEPTLPASQGFDFPCRWSGKIPGLRPSHTTLLESMQLRSIQDCDRGRKLSLHPGLRPTVTLDASPRHPVPDLLFFDGMNLPCVQDEPREHKKNNARRL